jgi:hypothetical protein
MVVMPGTRTVAAYSGLSHQAFLDDPGLEPMPPSMAVEMHAVVVGE